MVAVKTYEAERFLARPSPGVVAYLVHGNDAGLVTERARTIARNAVSDPTDAFQLTRMDGDDIAADPLKLVDEANSLGLFGGKRAILIQNGARSFLQPLEMLLDVPPQDCTIVIEAGALKRDAPLRKLCEGRKNAVSIECYPDAGKELEAVIDKEFVAAGLAIDPDTRELLTQFLGVDRMTTRAELAKLRLYAHGRGRVTEADVRAVIADASGLAVDDAVTAAFNGERTGVEVVMGRVFSGGGNSGHLLASALRHATLLHRALLNVEGGLSREVAAERSVRGPGKKHFVRQLSVWTPAKASRAVATLATAIQRVRREPNLDQQIAGRALWTISRLIDVRD